MGTDQLGFLRMKKYRFIMNEAYGPFNGVVESGVAEHVSIVTLSLIQSI